jgi:hypothetical protein
MAKITITIQDLEDENIDIHVDSDQVPVKGSETPAQVLARVMIRAASKHDGQVAVELYDEDEEDDAKQSDDPFDDMRREF